MSDVQPGQGIHESDGEPHTCVEPNGEHECGRGLGPKGVHSYLPALTHRCACGFEWEMEPQVAPAPKTREEQPMWQGDREYRQAQWDHSRTPERYGGGLG